MKRLYLRKITIAPTNPGSTIVYVWFDPEHKVRGSMVKPRTVKHERSWAERKVLELHPDCELAWNGGGE
jgi:hypothetical protein